MTMRIQIPGAFVVKMYLPSKPNLPARPTQELYLIKIFQIYRMSVKVPDHIIKTWVSKLELALPVFLGLSNSMYCVLSGRTDRWNLTPSLFP